MSKSIRKVDKLLIECRNFNKLRESWDLLRRNKWEVQKLGSDQKLCL